MSSRAKIYVILPGIETYHIRRVVTDIKRYNYFELGRARIFGETRIVKRYLDRDTWHIPDHNWDFATRAAMDDFTCSVKYFSME